MKTLLTIVSILLVLTLSAIIGVLFYAASPGGEVRIRDFASDRLGGILGVDIRIGGFETNVVSRIVLDDVEVFFKIVDTSVPLLALSHARIDYRIPDLLAVRPHIEAIAIDSLRVAVTRDSTGFVMPSPPGAAKKDKPEAGERDIRLDIGVGFGSVTVTGSSIAFEDRTIPLDIRSAEVELALNGDAGDTFDFELTADAWETAFRRVPVAMDRLSIAGSFGPQFIEIKRLNGGIAGLALEAKASLDLAVSPYSISAEAVINGDVADAVRIAGETIPTRFIPRTGVVTANARVSGSLSDPVVSAAVGMPLIELETITFSDIELAASYRDRQVSLDSMSFGLLGGKVTGSGRVAADSLAAHEFNLTLEGVRLENLWRIAYREASPYRGIVRGSLVTSGPLKDIAGVHAAARLRLGSVNYQNQRMADFTTDIIYDEGRFTLNFEQESTKLAANLRLDGGVAEGDFSFHTAKPGNLAGFAKIVELYGSLDVEGTVSGEMSNPTVAAAFKGSDIRFHGFPLDELNGDIVYRDKTAELIGSTFSGSLASVDSLTKPFSVPGLAGGVKYRGSLAGPVTDPYGSLELIFTRPSYKGVEFESVEALTELKNRSLTIERGKALADSLVLDFTGLFSFPDRKGSVALSADDRWNAREVMAPGVPDDIPDDSKADGLGLLDLDFRIGDSGQFALNGSGSKLNIAYITGLLPDSLDVDGIADFEIEFNGTINNPEGILRCSVLDPRFRQMSLDSISAAITIDPGQLTLDRLEAYINGQRTMIHGFAELHPSQAGYPSITVDSRIGGEAEGRNVMVQILKLVLPPETAFTGSSNYRLSFGGTVGYPSVSGNFHIVDAGLVLPHEAPSIRNLHIDATLAHSVVNIERIEGLMGEMPFHIGGQIATTDWKKFDTDITARLSGNEALVFRGNISADDLDCTLDISDFKLSALTPFMPALATLDGGADAKIIARGSMRDPSVIGSLHLSSVTYKPPGLDRPLHDGYADISFDRGAVRIDSLSTSLNGGRITARGEIEYRDGGLTHVSLAANASKIRMESRRQYSLLIDSAALTCTKQDNSYDVGGDIILGEGRLVANFQPRALLPFMQNVERPPQGSSEAATRVRLNVRVRGGDKLWIDNNLARMRLQADIGFIGTAAKPNVTGRMSIDEGYILYLDRKFKIDKGVMDFIDPNRINPVVDFSAATSLKTYQTMSRTAYDITLSITGALDQASFSLVSDPVLDQPDIVALLTIGATREQLTGGSRTNGDVTVSEILKTRAEALSSQRISSFFTKRVGNMLGLEDITVEGNLFDIGEASGPQLIASEQISDRMGITYTTAVGHLNEQSVRLDYRLNKYFSVEGQTDQRGRSGLDLKYRLRFK